MNYRLFTTDWPLGSSRFSDIKAAAQADATSASAWVALAPMHSYAHVQARGFARSARFLYIIHPSVVRPKGA